MASQVSLTQLSVDFSLNGPTSTQLSWVCSQDYERDRSLPPSPVATRQSSDVCLEDPCVIQAPQVSLTQLSVDFSINGPTSTQLSWGCSQDDERDRLLPPSPVATGQLPDVILEDPGVDKEEQDLYDSQTPDVTTPNPVTMSQLSFGDDPDLENFAISGPLPHSQEDEEEEQDKYDMPGIIRPRPRKSVSDNDFPIRENHTKRAECIKKFSFEAGSFSCDAIRLTDGVSDFCREALPGAFISKGIVGMSICLNYNKKRGSRLVIKSMMGGESERQLDRFVALTVAMARMKEVKMHRRPTPSLIKARYRSMLDVVYITRHLFSALYLILLPYSHATAAASTHMAKSTLQRFRNEDDCHRAILNLVQVLYLTHTSIEFGFKLRSSLWYGLVEDFWVTAEQALRHLDVVKYLGDVLWQVHQLVEMKQDCDGLLYIRPGHPAFPTTMVAFALETCSAHASTMALVEVALGTYKGNVRKDKHPK